MNTEGRISSFGECTAGVSVDQTSWMYETSSLSTGDVHLIYHLKALIYICYFREEYQNFRVPLIRESYSKNATYLNVMGGMLKWQY